MALARAASLVGMPRVVIRDLPMPRCPRTPALAPPPPEITSASDDARPRHSLSCLPSLSDLLTEEEHEVSLHRRRVRRKRASDSASKLRRSRLLAAK